MATRIDAVRVALLVASASLAGCVGYDESADGASAHAQALGITAEEERRIREALLQRAQTIEEIEEDFDDVDAPRTEAVDSLGWVRDGEAARTMSLADIGRKRRSARDGDPCIGDLNCESLHCSQAGRCVTSSVFKANGSGCTDHYECQSNRCNVGACVAATVQRFDGTYPTAWSATDGETSVAWEETAIDCGGPVSPYACPLGDACKEDSDCLAGGCMPKSAGSGRSCQLGRGGTKDIGARWRGAVTETWGGQSAYTHTVDLTRDCTPGAPPSSPSACMFGGLERSRDAQLTFVTDTARKRRSETGALVDAKDTRRFQQDTCIKHLLVNGCSTVSVQTRVHRSAYDYVICPKSSREAIAIIRREKAQYEDTVATRFGDEVARGVVPVDRDPFLCNQRFTHAVRYHTRIISGIGRDGRLQGPVEGFATSSGAPGVAVTPLAAASVAARDKFLGQLERLLLLNAACTKGRTKLVDGLAGALSSQDSLGTARITNKFARAWGAEPAFANNVNLTPNLRDRANWNICERVAPWAPSQSVEIRSDFAADEIPLVDALRASWDNGAFDIYSIDPEGNPYMPSNMNMQYGYDAEHSRANFGAYALSFGITLTKTTQTYSVGGSTFNVWGASGVAFQWTP